MDTLNKKQKFILTYWWVFQPSKHECYTKWLRRGMSKQSAFRTAKLK